MSMFPISPDAALSAPPPGKYHMWWQASPTDIFSASSVCRDATSAYEAAAGIEAAVAAALIGGPSASGPIRGDVALYFTPPDGPAFVLSASPERGVRLHFPSEATPPTYRDRLWHEMAVFTQAFRHDLSASLLFRVRSRFLRSDPLAWWRQSLHVVAALEAAADPPQAVGSLLFEAPGA